MLDRVVREAGICGAASSPAATRRATARVALGINALTAVAPTVPGAALFRAHSDDRPDGLEIALKGGQMGADDLSAASARAGGAAPHEGDET